MDLFHFIKYMVMPKRIKTYYTKSFYNLDVSRVDTEAFVFDVDDTLVHSEEDFTKKELDFFKTLLMTHKVAFLTNSKVKRPVLETFANRHGVPVLYKSKKPNPKSLKKVEQILKTKKLCMVGDRGIDVATAYFNKTKARILVKPVGNKAPFPIRLFRVIERIKLKTINLDDWANPNLYKTKFLPIRLGSIKV